MVRAAGTEAQLLGKEEKYVSVRLSSGEVRRILKVCRATIGSVGNQDHELIKIGKAGRSRWLGQRPEVRGVVMNLTITLTVVVKVVLQSDVNRQCHHGVNLLLVTKRVRKIKLLINTSSVAAQ